MPNEDDLLHVLFFDSSTRASHGKGVFEDLFIQKPNERTLQALQGVKDITFSALGCIQTDSGTFSITLISLSKIWTETLLFHPFVTGKQRRGRIQDMLTSA